MICDAHIHVGTPGLGDIPFEASPRFIADLLRKSGVGEFVFSSLSAQFGTLLKVLEREARETRGLFGEGAHPFLWLTGDIYDADPNLMALESGLWEGVKLHEGETPWVVERPADLDRVLGILEERCLPVQFHTGEDLGCHPCELLPFVKKHPKLRVDFSHCRPLNETIRCLRECPMLFTDTSFMPPENYAALVSAGVSDRVMFGTDFPGHVKFYEGKSGELYRNDIEGAVEYGYSEAVMAGNFFRFLRGEV